MHFQFHFPRLKLGFLLLSGFLVQITWFPRLVRQGNAFWDSPGVIIEWFPRMESDYVVFLQCPHQRMYSWIVPCSFPAEDGGWKNPLDSW